MIYWYVLIGHLIKSLEPIVCSFSHYMVFFMIHLLLRMVEILRIFKDGYELHSIPNSS